MNSPSSSSTAFSSGAPVPRAEAVGKRNSSWHSERLGEELKLARWGHFGRPVLIFPTAGGDCEEIERFLLIKVLAPLIEAGRIKVYSVDSIAGRTWMTKDESPRYCSRVQTLFDQAVYHEVVPAIRADCATPDIEIVIAGASIGAFNALSTLCRHPDVFRSAICLSGSYDLEHWLEGEFNQDFYFSSPLHFLPGVNGEPLKKLRERFVLLAHGQGNWESPNESWKRDS